MKNVLLAGAVAAALALTALSQQRAAAQSCPPQCQRGGEISFNTGVTFGVHWTPCHGHWQPNCCGPYGAPFGPYGYAPPPPYGYGPPPGPGARPPAPQAEQVGAPTRRPSRRPRRGTPSPPSRASVIRTRRYAMTTATATITDTPTTRGRITATAVDPGRAGRGPRSRTGGAFGRLVPPDAPGVFGRRGRRPLSAAPAGVRNVAGSGRECEESPLKPPGPPAIKIHTKSSENTAALGA